MTGLTNISQMRLSVHWGSFYIELAHKFTLSYDWDRECLWGFTFLRHQNRTLESLFIKPTEFIDFFNIPSNWFVF